MHAEDNKNRHNVHCLQMPHTEFELLNSGGGDKPTIISNKHDNSN